MRLISAHRRLVTVAVAIVVGASLNWIAEPAGASSDTTFTFVNSSTQTIWVGAVGNAGKVTPNGGGWAMAPSSTTTLSLPGDWAGRFWGRTGCNFDASGRGPCQTGDCGNVLACNGAIGKPPATLAEFTLQRTIPSASDYFDVSMVDGYNLPVTIKAVGPTSSVSLPSSCASADCATDLNQNCPHELAVQSGGSTVGCRSACEAFGTDQYCCRNAYGAPATCNPASWPKNYAAYFKSAYPYAYSYAYDDPTSTFTCAQCAYQIAFGPMSGSAPPPASPASPSQGKVALGPHQSPAPQPHVTEAPAPHQSRWLPAPPQAAACQQPHAAGAAPGAQGGGNPLNAYTAIQAECATVQSGTGTEPTSDDGGGQDVGWIANGDWLRYDNVDFSATPATQFHARLASGAGYGISGLVEVRLDSPSNAPVGTLAIANTAGWQAWRTVPANVSAVTGTHTVYLTFTSAQPADYVNLNWFDFSPC